MANKQSHIVQKEGLGKRNRRMEFKRKRGMKGKRRERAARGNWLQHTMSKNFFAKGATLLSATCKSHDRISRCRFDRPMQALNRVCPGQRANHVKIACVVIISSCLSRAYAT